MYYGKYIFQCRFESEAFLPVYKGSTFRGVFGRALKHVVCALRRQQCHECLLKSNCLYTQVFDRQLSAGNSWGSRQNTIPHPFVIQPPMDTRSHYSPDDTFEFALLLFGAANSQLPYFIYAMDRMGKIGIGKKIDGRRGQYCLESVRYGDKLIYSEADQKLVDFGAPRDLQLNSNEFGPKTETMVSFQLKTPLRIKYNNTLSPQLPFHVLIRAVLRRASSLLTAYNGGEPDLDYQGMVSRAHHVQIADSTLAWVDWKRYSHRQDQAMMMGGLKGSVTYSGDIGEYMPLIDFCSRVHLGKQTTFGLGWFTAEAAR